jgi:hypothetical protein
MECIPAFQKRHPNCCYTMHDQDLFLHMPKRRCSWSVGWLWKYNGWEAVRREVHRSRRVQIIPLWQVKKIVHNPRKSTTFFHKR